MSDLRALWKSRVGAILGIVRAGGTEHREVANMAAQVGADYHGRFVIELLQNASDQAASANLHESCVTIVRTGDFVALANEGIPFDKDKLSDITSLGLSRKNPQDAIGNKGLGFKSVFQVYEKFRLALPGFDEMSWRSRNRNAYGLEGEGNDALGYDFLYRDIENRLGGRANRPLCCIEVKASSGDGSESFPMTANEWDKARECHQTDESVYIIVRVANVRDDPQIADVIIDPFGLYGDGQVAVVSRDIWVYVGGPQSGGRRGGGRGAG